MYVSSILWCSWSDNHPPEDLAKFGYILDIKIKTFEQPSIILTTFWNLLQKSGYLYAYVYFEKPNMGHFFHLIAIRFFRSKSCGNSTKHTHWFWFTQIHPLFHTSIKGQCSFEEQKMIWLSNFVCGDWTYSVEEKPLNWKKSKIAYHNCIWFFFGVIQCFFFFYFSVLCTGDEVVVIIHKMIKTNLSMDKNKWK
jgi:hypothetical protein